ncbi:hypothetical protein HanIR_Chr09g0397821 [Helianthus annuus]|nr:hypothetical protein HanIR_Chr09g0397821 [Helianthus annuus]
MFKLFFFKLKFCIGNFKTTLMVNGYKIMSYCLHYMPLFQVLNSLPDGKNHQNKLVSKHGQLVLVWWVYRFSDS